MHMCSIWLYVVYTLHRTTLIPCPFFSSNRQGWKKTSLISVIFLLLPFLHVCVLFCFFWENDKKYTFCSSAPANPPRKTIHTKICSVICVFASLTLLACPASKGIPLKRGGVVGGDRNSIPNIWTLQLDIVDVTIPVTSVEISWRNAWIFGNFYHFTGFPNLQKYKSKLCSKPLSVSFLFCAPGISQPSWLGSDEENLIITF